MDKLFAMRAFVEIVDRGSLTAAGDGLGKSSPTMVRTLAALEEDLGVRLLQRTTRRLALTEEGRGYLGRVRRILADVDEAERALLSDRAEPEGDLRVTAPSLFGQRHVLPAVAAFLERHPKARVDLLLVDRVVDLLEESVDVAVRIGELPDSTMVTTSVGRMRRVVVGSPSLIERVGAPDAPAALAHLPCVHFGSFDRASRWELADGARVAVSGRLACNQAAAAVDACVAGLGFGRFLAYQVADELADGRLERVLEAFEPEPLPVSLVYPSGRLLAPRVRAFLDWTKAALAGGVSGPPW